jgi:arginyl-tRNA--protein-N-Asp/Glu arginylyltransferase
MMTKAIVWAQDQNKKYIYLGSAQRPGDTYKLQFEGLEWFDGQAWKNDMDELKSILKKLDTDLK